MGVKELSPPEAARVLARLEARLERVHGGTIEAFTRELGMVQSTLWRTIRGENQPTRKTAERLAKVEGVAVETILVGPRERAAQLAREGGVSEAAVRRVLAEPEPREPRPVLWWIDRMRLVAQTLPDDAPPASTPVPTGAGARRSVA